MKTQQYLDFGDGLLLPIDVAINVAPLEERPDTKAAVHRISAACAAAWAAWPSEHGMVEPLGPMMEEMEDARLRALGDRLIADAMRTWHKRKRKSKRSRA